MVEIFVDADACPVKEEVVKVADRHKLTVHIVSNSPMRLPVGIDVRRVVVPEGPDVADDWIADNIGAADIVITADIPLAARCLQRNALALGPAGKEFSEDSIGMAVAMRDLNSHLRDTGEIKGGGPAFSKKDRSNFLQALEVVVRRAIRDS